MRFPEFADEWKQTTLGEIAEVNPTTTKSLPLRFQYIDLESVEKGRIVKNNVLTREDAPSRAQRILNNGDVIFQMVRPYQQNNLYFNLKGNIPVVASTGYAQLRGFQSSLFLYYAVHTPNFLGEVLNRCTGSNYPAINSADLSTISLSLPSLAEQEKIASFLSLIDERIQSCSETIKEIKTLKAGLLSLRVYQADKQYVPLSYFGEMKHGYPFKSTSYDEDGTHRIVTISNVSGARYADMSKCNYLAELPHDIQQHQILSRNDILISLTGNVGRVSFCLADGDLLNQRVGVLSLCDEAYKEYIYQVLSDWRFEMSMVACGQGAAQLNISKSNVEGYLVPYEQSEYQEIGNFFSLLDDRIEIEEELLKQYEMQKKYLLRQMFI
ncbi:type I restriction modification DNA specificity domain protein [Porphyromonas gingivalis W4087]|uniref:restriction endonuclease subunit S n=1 Tax=Porphyromonas gingivalis TaxID=837 RepID=UPI0003AD5E54|nr:restriction endonuclease subunit S [Porphyromonas gingivalis]ERJ91248.1 type I restriction modification DNA specificity domain protein [Porphyromonas gingivalis W4087]